MRSIFVVSVLMFAACGDDGGSTKPKVDAPMQQMDAPATPMDMPQSGGNALGQSCTFNMDPTMTGCPAAHSCTNIDVMGASDMMGYCSPMCTPMNGACATGYTGPAGGMPQCALTTAMGQPPTLCAIVCTTNANCPAGLTCAVVQPAAPPNPEIKACIK